MAQSTSKSKFKPKTLEYLRKVEETGETLIITDLVTHCEGPPFFRFVPLSAKVAAKAARLEPFHPDPADRMIVAATIHHGAVLITQG